MDGWMGGWMDGWESGFKDCLQQSKIILDCDDWSSLLSLSLK